MGHVSIAYGLPLCQRSQSDQTKISIGLRTIAVAIGAIAVLTAVFIQCGIPGLSLLGSCVAWPVLSGGLVFLLLAAALKCVKKQSESARRPDQSASVDLPPIEGEARVRNGHGEFVVFSKSGKTIDSELYTRAYTIFNQFSFSSILNDSLSVEGAIELFGNRAESIEEALQAVDPDLSTIFIPRTLYELVFIHACIEEDLTAGSICPFLIPRICSLLTGKMEEEVQQQGCLSKLQSEQAERNCWHVCCGIEDSMHPKVIEVASRLNQLIISKIQSLQGFNFSNMAALLNSEIEFLAKYYENCSILKKEQEIASCSTPGPTTYFGYESTRGSIKPMGIRNQEDAEILHKAVAMECSTLALENIFLFRGSQFTKDQPYCLDNQQYPHSLSFGTSLFAGVVYDGGATAFHYMRQDSNEAFALIIPIKELGDAPFFVPLNSTVCQLFGHGENFHGRSKIWEGVNQKPRGIQDVHWEYLKTHLSRETLVNAVQRFYEQNVMFMKRRKA